MRLRETCYKEVILRPDTEDPQMAKWADWRIFCCLTGLSTSRCSWPCYLELRFGSHGCRAAVAGSGSTSFCCGGRGGVGGDDNEPLSDGLRVRRSTAESRGRDRSVV